MQVIKDGQLLDNVWRYISDDEGLSDGNVIVSLARWQTDKQNLCNSGRKLGVRINPADSLEDIANDLAAIQLIELYFPDFADGRLFSKAWLLRARYHYAGEIRAAGNFITDQVFYLTRVGVNAFSPENSRDLPSVLANLKDFTVHYQNSVLNTCAIA